MPFPANETKTVLVNRLNQKTTRTQGCLCVLPVHVKSGPEYGLVISRNAWASLDEDETSKSIPLSRKPFLLLVRLTVRNGGTSTLNSPMYKEVSSDDEESFGPSLFASEIPNRHASQSPTHDDDDFTPASTGSTSKKGVTKIRKRDPDKPPKPRKPRVPKIPNDSPSKTHVNRFKQNQGGEMVRTVSESPLAGGGGSSMARVLSFLSVS